jgi:hypothetical protein
MNGIKNPSYPMTFQNICSPTNFIKTTGLDTGTDKIVYTTSGIYRLYASSVAALNSKIENIFDANASTSWTTSANSYTRLSTGSPYTHSTFSINVIGLGLVYGEWIKIRFPRKCYVQDVLYTPFSLATSIGQGYLLGSNDGITYVIVDSRINDNELYTGDNKLVTYNILYQTQGYNIYRLAIIITINNIVTVILLFLSLISIFNSIIFEESISIRNIIFFILSFYLYRYF